MQVWQRVLFVGLALLVGVLLGPSSPIAAQQGRVSTTAADSQAFVSQYCVSCHNDRNKASVRGFSLERVDVASAGRAPERWEHVIRKLRTGQMPPASARRPDRAVSDAFATWLETEIDQVAVKHPNPGPTEALHRLNRTEYRNVVRDLLGVPVDVEKLLPPDPLGGGEANFDNIAATLRMSQGLLEQYLSAARRVSRLAIGGRIPVTYETFRAPQDLDQRVRIAGMPFGTRGGLSVDYLFPSDATYNLSIRVGIRADLGNVGTVTKPPPARMILSVDGEQVQQWEVNASNRNTTFEARRVPVKAGPRRVIATFVQEKPTFEQAGDRLPNLGVYLPGEPRLLGVTSVMLEGPLNVAGRGDTESRRRIFTCYPRTAVEETPCAQKIVSTLARRGLRRPVSDEDVALFMGFYEEGRAGQDFDAGIERALRALLVSPEFLYRVEAARPVAPGAAYRISDLELASRLSFFLWSSIPDDTLLDLAARDQLSKPVILEQQVRRMLRDPRSVALTEGFASFYLWIRNITDHTVAEAAFPNYDLTLRTAMAKELELFFDSIRTEDRSLLDLLDADYTFVNDRLASHYRIPNVRGPDFVRVTLPPDSPRRGILGKGGILTVTSMPQRTSPVKRGVWILYNVLGTPPPPPPANVPPLGEEKQDDGRVVTMRELMAQHRKNPACASCHNTIDPTGFALEQFDAIGRWREVDTSYAPIDPRGALPDGSKFSSFAEFRSILTRQPGPFFRTVTEKLLVYALGRGYEYSDAPAVRKVVADAAKDGHKFSAIVLGIVKSVPFQMRRAPVEAPAQEGVAASR